MLLLVYHTLLEEDNVLHVHAPFNNSVFLVNLKKKAAAVALTLSVFNNLYTKCTYMAHVGPMYIIAKSQIVTWFTRENTYLNV